MIILVNGNFQSVYEPVLSEILSICVFEIRKHVLIHLNSENIVQIG